MFPPWCQFIKKNKNCKHPSRNREEPEAGKANEQCVSSTMTTKAKASVQTLKKKEEVKIGDYRIQSECIKVDCSYTSSSWSFWIFFIFHFDLKSKQRCEKYVCLPLSVCVWVCALYDTHYMLSCRAGQLRRIIGLSSRRLVMTHRGGVPYEKDGEEWEAGMLIIVMVVCLAT